MVSIPVGCCVTAWIARPCATVTAVHTTVIFRGTTAADAVMCTVAEWVGSDPGIMGPDLLGD